MPGGNDLNKITIEKLIDKINDILDLKLKPNDYDLGIILNSLAKSNCNSISGSKSHQDHIAITGKKMYFFPVLNNYNLSGFETYFKSVYTLCIGIKFYKKNVEYLFENYKTLDSSGNSYESLPDNFMESYNDDIMESRATIKPSRRKSEDRNQLELGIRKIVSSDNLLKLRSLAQLGDNIVLLKNKKELIYDLFIVKENDLDIRDDNIIKSEKELSNVNSFETDIDNYYNQSDGIPTGNIVGTNTIYMGAPGTGKSHAVDQIIREQYGNYYQNENSEFVYRATMYNSYSYFDFVGDILPTKKEEDISYDFNPGIFTRALLKAIKHPNKKIYLVLEEMSRCDIESVFGDVFQLLDRDESGKSSYGIDNKRINRYLTEQKLCEEGEKVFIPNNLFIIGTLNNNDQNTNVIDTAFKRRFSVKVLPIKAEEENNFKFKIGNEIVLWNDFFINLNKFIVRNLGLNEDKQIGQWFIKGSDNIDENSKEIKNKLLSYLWEDVEKAVFDNDEKMFPDVFSFSELYEKFNDGNGVFNKKILDNNL